MQRRGRERRAALLEAAATLLAEGGFGAVSHRAVAERAGLPLAATTYYFGSRDDLTAAAFESLMHDELARLRTLLAPAGGGESRDTRPDEAGVRGAGPGGHGGAGGPDSASRARALVTALVPDDPAERRYQLAMYELYVQAGRGDGRLRELARAWTDGCVAVTGELLRAAGYAADDVTVRLIAGLADGLALELLVEDRGDLATAETAITVLTRALETLAASPAPAEAD